MKNKYFISFLIIIFLVFFYYFNKQKDDFSDEPDFRKESFLKEILRWDNLPKDFRGTFVDDLDNYNTYTNKMFSFSLDVPNEMKNFESINIREQGDLEYENYVIRFIDNAPEEGIFNILIQKTSILTIKEYTSYHKDKYKNYDFKERNEYLDFNLDTVIYENKSATEKSERRVLFIKDGYIFDIMTRDLPINDVYYIWNSFKFLD